MKKTNEIYDWTDAFLALNEVDDEDVDGMIRKDKKLNEGKEYSLLSSAGDLDDAQQFLDQDAEEEEIEVIDVDADSAEHLKKKEDYVGQAILICNRCKAKRFIDMEDLEVDADDPELYNVEDECPHCHTSGDGYELLGQVGKVATEPEVSEDEEPEEPTQEVVPEPEETEEAQTEPEESDEPKFENDEAEPETKEEPEAEEDAEVNPDSDDLDLDDVFGADDEENGEDSESEESDEGSEEKEPKSEDEEESKKKKEEESLQEDLEEPVEENSEAIYQDVDWTIVEVKCLDDLRKFAEETRWGRFGANRVGWRRDRDNKTRVFVFIDKHSGQKYLSRLTTDGNVTFMDVNGSPIDDLTVLGAPDLLDAVAPIVEEAVELNKYAQEAWLMNKVMSSMNNEEAYYSGWLYIWPDGETKEECAYDFGDKESFDELKDSFILHYKDCHEDGLYDADAETLEYAHKMDSLLGLRPIDNILPRSKRPEKQLETYSVKDILEMVAEPEHIGTVIAIDKNKECDRDLFEGVYSELPANIESCECNGFDVADGVLSCNVDTEEVDSPRTVASALDKFADDDTEKISLWDQATGDEVFAGNKKDAIDKFGNVKFISIEAPAVVRLNLCAPDILSQEEIYGEEETTTPEDTLVKHIIDANNLSQYKLDKPNTNEYWIKDCINNKDDLKIIFESFVRDLEDPKLIKEFKKVTGYRTALDEELVKEYGEDALDGLDKLVHNVSSDDYIDPATGEEDPEMERELAKEEPEDDVEEDLDPEDGAEILKHNIEATDDKYIDPATGDHDPEMEKELQKEDEAFHKEDTAAEKAVLKKALTQLEKPGVFGVVIGYNQGKGMKFLDTPLVKKSFKELQDFEKGFRRGKEGTKVVVRTVYPKDIDGIKSYLGMTDENLNKHKRSVHESLEGIEYDPKKLYHSSKEVIDDIGEEAFDNLDVFQYECAFDADVEVEVEVEGSTQLDVDDFDEWTANYTVTSWPVSYDIDDNVLDDYLKTIPEGLTLEDIDGLADDESMQDYLVDKNYDDIVDEINEANENGDFDDCVEAPDPSDFYDYDDYGENLNNKNDSKSSLKEALEGNGVSSKAAGIVSALLEDEWEAVKGYEDAAAQLSELDVEDKEKILKVLGHISGEEAIHVGQLEQVLHILNPDYEAKQQEGHDEGREELNLKPESEEDKTEEDESEDEEKEEDEDVEESFKSFKTRKELSAAIKECKNNSKPYTVRRSVKEGYRYDLLETTKAEDKSIEENLEIDETLFDNDINKYFDEAYEESVLYTTTSGTIDEEGTIRLKGSLEFDENLTPVEFKLTRETPLEENLNSPKSLEEALKTSSYKVTNNLSKEVFEFKFDKE